MTCMTRSTSLTINIVGHAERSENAHYRCVTLGAQLIRYIYLAVVRFSTVGGEAGSADSARDPRGFAIK